jgi:acetyl-CoA carboxylase biotin carboxylase subunit
VTRPRRTTRQAAALRLSSSTDVRENLIANRGEIALRVIRACKELGVRTLAVYSEADVDSLHVQLADEAICIGSAPSSDSYLKIDRILSAAEVGNVDAIHPGYGFLSENAHFAEVCESCQIKFIGPSASAMHAMGDKNSARASARKAGVSVTPGSDGIVEDEEEALKVAKKIGFPVMIKAVAGGGGRGMRAAHNEASLFPMFHAAKTEAEKAFGNGDVYIEKLIVNPHHIEFPDYRRQPRTHRATSVSAIARSSGGTRR